MTIHSQRKNLCIRNAAKVFLLILCVVVTSLSANASERKQSKDLKVTDLKEVIVKPKKEKYSKKNNPAVDLMQNIRESAAKTDPSKEDHYSYDTYSKLTIGLNDFNRNINEDGLAGAFALLTDTSDVTGSRLLLVSIKEKISTKIQRRKPHANKEIIRGYRSKGVDEAFNQQNIYKSLDDVMREIDIYGNDVTLMQNRFVSPLSAIGADYYKYFITDTIEIDGKKYTELTFTPRNPESFSFTGNLLVAADSTYFIKRVKMRVPRDINLNYVDNIFVTQEFELDSLGNRHKVSDRMNMELQLVKGTQSFYAERINRYDGFSYSPRDEYKEYYGKTGHKFTLPEAETRNDEFWLAERRIPLSRAESNLDGLMASLRKKPLFAWAERILKIIVNGYVMTGKESKFDFGPVNTLVSYNTAEGVRFRIGGVTTANLSPHLFARGYVAYGLRDHKVKYRGELEYSFNRKKHHSREFPIKSIRGLYQYDTDMLGQHYLFTNADNIFLSLKRKESDLITYRRLAELTYTLELENNFSLSATLRNEQQEATKWVPFQLPGDVFDKSYRQTALAVTLRYAPGEKFSQGYTNRYPINMDAPIFQITHEYGPKKFLGSAFTLNRTEVSIFKRFWFSAFGYADVTLKGGKIWSQVQFPALLWPNANLSYTIQQESYSLMNPMEFANDHYASLDLTYWLNGWILNRIPYVNKAKLREIFTFKALTGGLTKRNNPQYNENLYRIPYDSLTRTMTSTPYMEIGVGIDNIFTILRIDYVWRLTYRDAPDIDKSGLRIALHFQF